MGVCRPLTCGALVLAGMMPAGMTTLARAQDRGAALLDQQLRGITVTPRVLMIGAHPDDENTALIAWLARGQRIETAYLSLTRGESGINAAGYDFGDVLGAIRTAEVLAARRIDGGRQYFTRALDFGLSRSAKESYEHWPHDAVLGDVVTVIRSFRPHVVVALFSGTPADSNGHHEVAGLLAREGFELAADTVQFPLGTHGYPWEPRKLYEPGKGLTIDIGGYDAVMGRTYTDIAAESRARHRTQGYPDSLLQGSAVTGRWVSLTRLASRVTEGASATERSLFDGIDTTFARLSVGMPDTLARFIALAGAYADSARELLDLRRPDGVVRHAARAARFASQARTRAPHCLHPDRDASASVSSRAGCRQPWLEVDASIDLVRRRAVESLLAAAGVSVEMLADRELVAYSDSTKATLTIANNGEAPVQFVTVSISGAPDYSIRPREILPDSIARWTTTVRVLASTEPWWFGEKVQDLHPGYASVLDGLGRPATSTGLITVPAVAIPEEIRRASDVTVTLRIAGEVVTTSLGSINFRTSEPLVGVQDRPVSGVPSVGLGFDHNLEWIPLGKPIDRLLRFSLRSYADAARKLSFGFVAPPEVRVESLPPAVTLRPRESKELVLRLRGTIKEGRFMFGVVGRDADSATFTDGLRTIQYPHLPPVRMSRGSAMWLKGVEIAVPSRLNVAYLQGAGDLITLYLRQLGVRINVLGYDELLNADLSQFTTIVVGVRAYETHPELVAYNGKLLDFVRRGGTLVVQGGTNAIYNIGIFPYVLDAPPTGGVDRVTEEQAPVKVLNPGARILDWPNRITEADWNGWVTERAAYMPRVIDPRYTPLLEMHDPGEPASRGALLVTSLGRGTYIYTTLALHRQLQGAVSGGARLFVNLLSAGLAPEPGKKAARQRD